MVRPSRLEPSAARSWAVVVAGTALLCALPALIGWLPVRAGGTPPGVLLARIRGSAAVGYSGLVESTGSAGLPNLPRLGAANDLLSGTTRSRVWYAGPASYRVDRLTPIAEEGTYRDQSGSWTWSSATNEAQRTEGEPALRLPTATDLLPPNLARRLAAPATAQESTALPARRIAGRTAAGLRITPAGATTIGRIDVWADARTGVALRVQVSGRGASHPTVVTRFLDVRLHSPDPSVLAFSPPAEANVSSDVAPDLVATIDRFSPYELPATVVGLPRQGGVTGLHGGAGTYGRGYGMLAVLPLRDRLADALLAQMSGPPGRAVRLSRGRAAALDTPLLTVLVSVGPYQSFLLAGTVPADVLVRAATSLSRSVLPLRGAPGAP